MNDPSKIHTAWELAGDWWWDEDYQAAMERGKVLWDCATATKGGQGRTVRLARLGGWPRHVHPDTRMRLVKKP